MLRWVKKSIPRVNLTDSFQPIYSHDLYGPRFSTIMPENELEYFKRIAWERDTANPDLAPSIDGLGSKPIVDGIYMRRKWGADIGLFTGNI